EHARVLNRNRCVDLRTRQLDVDLMQSCSCSCSMAFGRDGARSRFGRGSSKRRFVYIGLVGFEPFRLGMAVNLAARLGEQFVVEREDERVLGTGQRYV